MGFGVTEIESNSNNGGGEEWNDHCDRVQSIRHETKVDCGSKNVHDN